MTEYGTQDGSAGEKVRAGQGRSGEVRAGQVRHVLDTYICLLLGAIRLGLRSPGLIAPSGALQ